MSENDFEPQNRIESFLSKKRIASVPAEFDPKGVE